MSRIGVREVSAVIGVDTLSLELPPWTPGSQIFKKWTCDPEELVKIWQNSGGGRFVFDFGTADLAVSKEATTHPALPPALSLGTWRPKLLSRPSVQTDNTPSKVNYVLCLLIAECSFTWTVQWPSFCYSISLQTWYLDFCPWWFLPPYYWRRHHSSGPLWPKKHSAIMMWPLPPLLSTLPRFSTALYSAVKSLQAK